MDRQGFSVYFFGDSICFGQYVSSHRTWTVNVASKIEEFASALGQTAVTQVSAVNGETTRRALERLEHDILSHEPEIVWVQFGLNDANYWRSDRGLPRTLLDTYSSNMTEIITRIFSVGTLQVLVATNHRVSRIPVHLADNRYSENVVAYNKAVRNVVEKFTPSPVYLVDIERELYSAFGDSTEYLLDDGVHLGPKGHDKYAEIAAREIRTAISRMNAIL